MADISTTVSGIRFENPVMPAAGPNVRSVALMRAAIDGGAGAIVAKTVSVVPAQDARPTIRRTSGRGLMNTETWSEVPVEEFLDDLRAVRESCSVPLIPSVGYKPEEVARLGALLEREIAPAAIEFSTHYSGSSHEPLIAVARALREAVSVPIWMKISPTTPEITELVRAAEPYVDAFVAINSYGPVLDFDPADPVPRLGSERGSGWLSGAPIRTIALDIVYRIAHAQSRPVIGVGGVESGVDAITFLMAGASAVQVCSAAIRRGNDVYGRIAGEIDAWLDEHGYAALTEVVGAYTPRSRPASTHAVMTIDRDACTGCRACLNQCIHGAIQWDADAEKAYIVPEACIGCGYCQDVCRYEAMKLKETPT
jgi:dihydroorotate dehydrogenase subfamily 1